MPKRAQTQEIVSRQGWLSYAPAPFRQAVLDRCKLMKMTGGSTIYSVGDPPGGMFGLVAGSFAISIAPGERGPYIAHFAQPGMWFGEAAAFTEQPRRIGLAVTRDSEVLHLPLPAIREIVASDPGTWRFFGLASIIHNDDAIGGADDLLIRDHVKRSIAVLLRLGGCRYRTPREPRPIEVDVSQDDFAAMTNMARTTAGTVLRKLEADGGVQVSYRRVRIIAPDALRAMLEAL
jgi:CRP-like cAMP-binding protein